LQFVIIARVVETYLDGTGYNTYATGNQYPEVGYWILRGILNFETLDNKKKYKFQTLYTFILLAFISRKVLEIMFT
jgi:hypothetical protein